jgi:mono/diheme cytochrome c family protein
VAAKSVLPRAAMPGYDLTNEQLASLAAYMLSLDFDKYRDIAIDKKVVNGWSLLHQNGCLSCHLVNGVGLKTGHDLSTEGSNRSADWLSAYFQKPSEHRSITKSDELDRLNSEEVAFLIKYLSSLK